MNMRNETGLYILMTVSNMHAHVSNKAAGCMGQEFQTHKIVL